MENTPAQTSAPESLQSVTVIAHRAPSPWPRVVAQLLSLVYPLAALGALVLIVRAIGASGWLWLALLFGVLIVAFNRPKFPAE